MSRWCDRLAVFDLETTGVDVETARIVTAYLGVLDANGVCVQERSWLVDPGVEIPAGAAAVHGIDTARARAEGMPAATGVAQIAAAVAQTFADGVPVTAYNAPYDFTVLDREARRHGAPTLVDPRPVVDPLVLDRALDKYRRGKRTLTVTTEVYGVALTAAHDAGADALAAGRLAQAICRKFPDELDMTAAELHDAQVSWARAQAEDFQAYMRRVRDPSFTTSGRWPMR